MNHGKGKITVLKHQAVALSIAVLVFASGCASMMGPQFGPVETVLNKNVQQSRYKRIAVIAYDVSGYDGRGIDKISGTALADRYTVELMRAGYDVIERQRLEALLQEQSLGMTGLTDPKTSLKVGNMLGVQGFVFGSVSGKPNAFSIMTKLVDVETGSTVWSVVLSNNIEKNAIAQLRKTLDAHYAGGGK